MHSYNVAPSLPLQEYNILICVDMEIPLKKNIIFDPAGRNKDLS